MSDTQETFTKHYESAPGMLFSEKYNNGTGHFDALVSADLGLKPGQTARMYTGEKNRRRILIIGTFFGNVVVFDRYTDGAAREGSSHVLAFNMPPEIERLFRDLLTVPLNHEMLTALVGAWRPKDNIGYRLARLKNTAAKERQDMLLNNRESFLGRSYYAGADDDRDAHMLLQWHHDHVKQIPFRAAFDNKMNCFGSLVRADLGLTAGEMVATSARDAHGWCRIVVLHTLLGNVAVFDKFVTTQCAPRRRRIDCHLGSCLQHIFPINPSDLTCAGVRYLLGDVGQHRAGNPNLNDRLRRLKNAFLASS